MSLTIVLDKCTGCSLCIKSCPFGALEMRDRTEAEIDALKAAGKKAFKRYAVVEETKCTLCGACVESCKFEAILLEKAEPAAAARTDLSAYRGVWVFGEQRRGVVQGVAMELAGKGRELADKLGVPLTMVVLGHNLDATVARLGEYPIDEILVVDAPELADYRSEPYSKTFARLINDFKPEAVLAGATTIGRDFLARVAIELHAGLTADCTGLDIGDVEGQGKRLLLQTRPAFGGNIMATIITPNHRPQMATVRHKVMQEMCAGGSIRPKVTRVAAEPALCVSRTEILNFVEQIEDTVNIAEADIIVSGGRGLGKAENFSYVHDLAKAIGGAIGASRAAVDSGWIPYSHQVGQTGKTVQPKVYIACGISGAVQHLVGMQSAETIIAINKDPNAPIFEVATFGIVGEIQQVLPALTQEFSLRGRSCAGKDA